MNEGDQYQNVGQDVVEFHMSSSFRATSQRKSLIPCFRRPRRTNSSVDSETLSETMRSSSPSSAATTDSGSCRRSMSDVSSLSSTDSGTSSAMSSVSDLSHLEESVDPDSPTYCSFCDPSQMGPCDLDHHCRPCRTASYAAIQRQQARKRKWTNRLHSFKSKYSITDMVDRYCNKMERMFPKAKVCKVRDHRDCHKHETRKESNATTTTTDSGISNGTTIVAAPEDKDDSKSHIASPSTHSSTCPNSESIKQLSGPVTHRHGNGGLYGRIHLRWALQGGYMSMAPTNEERAAQKEESKRRKEKKQEEKKKEKKEKEERRKRRMDSYRDEGLLTGPYDGLTSNDWRWMVAATAMC